jgi:hypothetical protein
MIKVSVPRDELEPVEVVLHELLDMPLVPSPAQRDAIARLRPHLEEALRALDSLERAIGLSGEEWQQQEALRVLRGAIDELE